MKQSAIGNGQWAIAGIPVILSPMKIALIPNRDKPDAIAAARRLRELLAPCADVALLMNPTHDDLLQLQAALIVVLGGDGSILSIAQSMHGIHTPVVGINFGKLGYLAAFSLDQFIANLDLLLAAKAPTSQRLMLEGAIYRLPTSPPNAIPPIVGLGALAHQSPQSCGFALNDVVINAGHPFRMIELEIQIDGLVTTTFRSDGVILATASGSTGYNLAAAGPLLSPDVPAMVLTPICPHSLSFRPVVLASGTVVLIRPLKLNEGSRVNFDGQFTHPFTESDCLLIRRAPDPLTLVENPTVSHWQMLAQKLHWARSPRQ